MTSMRDLGRRIIDLFSRADIPKVDDAHDTQRVQLDIHGDGVVDDEIEHIQPYGYSFNPGTLEDLQGLVLALGGSREDSIAIHVHSPATRPQDAGEGEGGLYNANGWMVYLDAGGILHLGTKDASEAAVRGDAFKTLYDAHTHPTPFGPTSAPVTPISTELSEKTKVD